MVRKCYNHRIAVPMDNHRNRLFLLLFCYLKLFVYKFDSLLFILVYHLSIYLRCCDAFVTQEAGDSIEASS